MSRPEIISNGVLDCIVCPMTPKDIKGNKTGQPCYLPARAIIREVNALPGYMAGEDIRTDTEIADDYLQRNGTAGIARQAGGLVCADLVALHNKTAAESPMSVLQ